MLRLIAFCLFIPHLVSTAYANPEIDSDCALGLIRAGAADLTVAEIRDRCRVEPDITLGEERNRRERSLFGDEFSILLHRDNYLLPVAHNNETGVIREEFGEAQELNDEEIKFQISIRSLLLNNLPFDANLYAAYTNQSHWQAYNEANSRPFRETNHQPELMLDFPVDRKYRGITLNTLRFALNHQSNGRSGLISRSWNRAYTELLMSTKYSKVNLRSWWLITDDEDNPDIDNFMGRFQIDGLREFGKHQLHWKLRHNLQSDSKGAYELGWSRQIGGRDDIHAYLHYFNGYGESLIDYNRKTERIGLGFKIGQ
ncbi:MAG: phospholipase A [Gammaproteobacteria bacterium]|nr:phospholipase A [Gammaproteobacteria bacterium]